MHANARTQTHVRNCVCIYACKQTQTHADTRACAYTCICVRVRTLDRILYTRPQFVQTNGLTTRNSSIWREDSRSGGRADLDRWDGARLARSRAGAGAEPAVRRWVRERKMRLGWNRPAAVAPLDLEQDLDTWQRLGITFAGRRGHGCGARRCI